MQPLRWNSLAIGAALTAVSAAVLAITLGGLNCGFELFQVWIFSGWKCGAWILSAFGLGVMVNKKVLGRGVNAYALASAFGIAIQLVADQWLGSLGLLGLLGGLIAVGILIPGWIFALRFIFGARELQPQEIANNFWWWPALPAVAALLISASVSPGIMWSTEFGGYDALEYHLQAPKEWLAVGAIRPLEFLAYSGMPNFVEGGFLHLMSASSDARDGVVACQLLHASMLLVAAFVLADTAVLLARRLKINEHVAQVGALCAMLATPWTIVVGSLAYSESGGGFLHLMSASSDARDGVLACQLLHASMLLVAAFVLADTAVLLARRLKINEHVARVGALCAMLATPWTIVVGSLAYSESGILLAFAAILNVVARESVSRLWGGLMLGVLVAVVVGSKASSIILVVPAVLAWWALGNDRDLMNWKSIAWSALALTIGLAPWLARNWYYTGAPFFPLASNLLGLGWWSTEQSMRWNQAHASDASVMQRAHALWTQLFIFGVGENPTRGEPWKWFWGPLPWIAACSVVVLTFRRATRSMSLALTLSVAIIVLGWMFATHLQSRFLIPLVIPFALMCGLASALVFGGAAAEPKTSATHQAAPLPLLLILAAWACLPAWNFVTDTPGSVYFIGQNGFFQGDDDWRDLRSSDASLRQDASKNLTAELVINHLHPEWRVLSVGWSTPLWIKSGASLAWSSVWDTNPIEACHGMTVNETIALLSKKYDAIILDVPMLERWRYSGWLSPKINMDQLMQLSKSVPHLASLNGGKILLGLRANDGTPFPFSLPLP